MASDAKTPESAISSALFLSDLTVQLESGEPIVEHVDLTVSPGEIVCLVGESGSGKTTTALALMGYCADDVAITQGALRLRGETVRMDESMREVRGAIISYVPQDPGRSLNPSLRIAASIEDVMRAHRRARRSEKVIEPLLETVGLPSSDEFMRRYPHQLSGGQQQRVCIALALSCEPAIVILDEPTTGLDVVTQARILDELVRLRNERRISMVYVTHDLAVVARIADRVAVMYAGRIVEEGPASLVLRRPQHPYTRGLLASVPDHVRPRMLEAMPGIAVGVGERPIGCSFAPRCAQRTDDCMSQLPALEEVGPSHLVRCFHWRQTPGVKTVPLAIVDRGIERAGKTLLSVEGLLLEHRSRREVTVAAADVSFDVDRGSCVAIVGESGSGKTTIVRAIAGLHAPTSGRIMFRDEALPPSVRHRTVDQRRLIQLVSQNPADALNPRHTVRESIGRPAQVLRGLRKQELSSEVEKLLEYVRLPSSVASRYPGELSGGERQRVALARALAAGPELILCDEITSALDVSVQAAVLKLLNELRESVGVAFLFVSHDLGVVSTVAEQTLVLENGVIRERGRTRELLAEPKHPYTRQLLAAAPTVSDAIDAPEPTGRGTPDRDPST